MLLGRYLECGHQLCIKEATAHEYKLCMTAGGNLEYKLMYRLLCLLNWNMQFIVGVSYQYTSKLNSDCVWNRAVSCLPTYKGGEVGIAMQHFNELQKPNLRLGKAWLISCPDPSPEKRKEGLMFWATFIVTWGGAYGIKNVILYPGHEFSDDLNCCTV